MPLLLGDAPNCATVLSARFASWCPAKCARPYDEAVASVATTVRVLSDFAERTPGVVFFNAHDRFCDGRGCGPFIPGSSTLAYEDNNHLTPEASFSLWPFLRCDVFAHIIVCRQSSRRSPDLRITIAQGGSSTAARRRLTTQAK